MAERGGRPSFSAMPFASDAQQEIVHDKDRGESKTMMLLRLLSWPYLKRHLLRWALTMAGIVLGVAVFVAMHTANRSIFSAFDKTVDQIAGSTQLPLFVGEFGFEDPVLQRVEAVPEV